MIYAHTQMDAHEEPKSEEKPLCSRVATIATIAGLQETLKEVV